MDEDQICFKRTCGTMLKTLLFINVGSRQGVKFNKSGMHYLL